MKRKRRRDAPYKLRDVMMLLQILNGKVDELLERLPRVTAPPEPSVPEPPAA